MNPTASDNPAPQAPRPSPPKVRLRRSVGFRLSPGQGLGGEGGGELAMRAAASQFPACNTATIFRADQVAGPRPLPKRPKGRLFVGVIVLGILSGLGFVVWDTFLRYQAYGTVAGRVVRVPAVNSGIVQSIHVREGDRVQSGDLLATIENRDLQQQLARLGDQLQIAQARLDAEMAELNWQSRLFHDRVQHSSADYFSLWGELLNEQSKLADFQLQLRRQEGIRARVAGAVSEQEIDGLRFAEAGQRAKVEKLQTAVETLKNLAEVPAETETCQDQIKPLLSHIESLQADMGRLRSNLQQGEIRSPVDGVVLSTRFFAGEFASEQDTLVEVMESGSIETVLYVPQRLAGHWQLGDTIEICIAPSRQRIAVAVSRFGDRMEAAPPHLARYYRSHETLLKVHARPAGAAADPAVFRLGSEVRLPVDWLVK